MHHATDTLTANDGTQLFTQRWLPDAPRGALVIAHGYAEHSGRYADFAQFLVQHDFAVYALDHRGHGRSSGERANVKVFRAFVDDLSRFLEFVRERHPQPPRFLLGHSMGGIVAAQLALERPHLVEGLILSAPFFQNAVKVPPPLLAVSGVVSRFLPSWPTLKIDTDLLSRDQAVVEAYEADPLVYTGGTKARLGTEMLAAGNYVIERADSVTCPLLMLLGTADGIADPAGGKRFFDRASSEDKTSKLYEGFYHELLNEPKKEEVYRDVLEWLHLHL